VANLGRVIVWTSRRGTHLGRHLCASARESRTYERKRSDHEKPSSSSCKAGALHIWHVDEVFAKINGELHSLWRVVDHEGEVLGFYVNKTRNRADAVKFLKKVMKRYGRPEIIVTDGLRSYSAAMREIGNLKRRKGGRWKNNRAENSHQPLRRRQAAMLKFRRTKMLQKFLAAHGQIHNHFNSERHLVSGEIYKQRRSAALAEWRAVAA
jgi:putative transposase